MFRLTRVIVRLCSEPFGFSTIITYSSGGCWSVWSCGCLVKCLEFLFVRILGSPFWWGIVCWNRCWQSILLPWFLGSCMLIILLRLYFHGTGNLAHTFQHFGISEGGGGVENPNPSRYATVGPHTRVYPKYYGLLPSSIQQMWYREAPVDGRTTMSSESVCQVARNWTDITDYYHHLYSRCGTAKHR
jgi:hypothetical protein